MKSFLRRKRKKGIFRTRRFSSRMRKSAGAVFSKGNSVLLFGNGGDFFPEVFRSIRHADSSVQAEFYIIRNDATGAAFADALIHASLRGVNVSLIYDYLGCIDTPSSYFKRLEGCGVRCLPFNKPAFGKLHWLDLRDHRKLVIIDGSTAFLGGLNIGDEYSGYGESPKHWRDFGIRVDGPAVTEILDIFRRTWEGEGGYPYNALLEAASSPDAKGEADVMVVNGSPRHNRSLIRSAFRLAMAGASENIKIITPYFIPGPRVVRSLLRAAARGVKVQIILPSISDAPIAQVAGKAYLTPLLKAGVEIYERQSTILHAKLMIVDDCWVTIGSANLDYRSFFRNFELNVIIDSHEFGSQADLLFYADLAKSRRITYSEHEKRSWFAKIMERLCDPISRFL